MEKLIRTLSKEQQRQILTDYLDYRKTGSSGDTELRRVTEQYLAGDLSRLSLMMDILAREVALMIACEQLGLPYPSGQ